MPLYEGKTVGEAMRKALGIEAKKTGRYLGTGKPTNSKLPGQRHYDKPRNPRKQNESGNRFASQAAISSAQQRAISSARSWIANPDVSEGAFEVAVAYVYDNRTGQILTLEGTRRGRHQVGEISYYFSNGPAGFRFDIDGLDSSIHTLLATAHSHPQASQSGGFHERRRARRTNSRNDNMTDAHHRIDTALSRLAPLFIKTPSGDVERF